MKFIHAADIHLDSPLCGLARYEGVPAEQMQSATRRAFINLVDLACAEAVDFLLIAGDLYDVDWKDYNTGLFFNQQMTRLREANIPVFIVLGNHDAGNSITKQLRLPDNVKEFSTNSPETVILEKIGVAIHGQSFATKAVTDNISLDYPPAIAGYYNIGLLHTAVNGREGHDNYAPCSVQDLLAQGYDYWALGHVHNREILHADPYIVFSGNLQGRHVRETGAKGCTLVTVSDAHKTTLMHCPVDVLRWGVCSVDASQAATADEIVDKVRETVLETLQTADGRPLALRLMIEGTCPAHTELHSNTERWSNEIRAIATDVGLGSVWVEKIYLNTRAVSIAMQQDESPFDELLHTLRTLPQSNDSLLALSSELRHLKQALPLEARTEYGFDPENPDTIRQMLNRVEGFLMGRLLPQA